MKKEIRHYKRSIRGRLAPLYSKPSPAPEQWFFLLQKSDLCGLYRFLCNIEELDSKVLAKNWSVFRTYS